MTSGASTSPSAKEIFTRTAPDQLVDADPGMEVVVADSAKYLVVAALRIAEVEGVGAAAS